MSLVPASGGDFRVSHPWTGRLDGTTQLNQHIGQGLGDRCRIVSGAPRYLTVPLAKLLRGSEATSLDS